MIKIILLEYIISYLIGLPTTQQAITHKVKQFKFVLYMSFEFYINNNLCILIVNRQIQKIWWWKDAMKETKQNLVKPNVYWYIFHFFIPIPKKMCTIGSKSSETSFERHKSNLYQTEVLINLKIIILLYTCTIWG